MKSRLSQIAAVAFLATIGCQEYNVSVIGEDGAGGSGLGLVTGRVCDPSGAGYVSGAEVWIPIDYDGDGQNDLTIRTTTDGDGAFTLEDVPDGFWTVYVKKGSYEVEFRVEVVDGLGVHGLEYCLDPETVQIAVVSGEYDTVQEVLKTIGLDFDLFNGKDGSQYLDLLGNPEALKTYDIVFLNCGINDMWMERRTQIGMALKEYVNQGGSVYASDWSHSFVEAAFPEAIDWYGDDRDVYATRVGEMGNYVASVLDTSMKQILGSEQADLYYDLSSWGVAEVVGPNSEILIEGDVTVFDWTWGYQSLQKSPLAVRLAPGNGRVIYTSFHNEPQTTVDMDLLLKDIILSL